MSNAFKEPILAAIYRATGIIIVIIGLLYALSTSLETAFIGGLVALLITGIVALFFFGLAQIFTYIGKTAFYAESISDTLTISMHEIKKSTKEISEHMKSMVMRDVSRDAAPAPERAVNCPHCGASIPISKLHKGNNSCPECSQTFVME